MTIQCHCNPFPMHVASGTSLWRLLPIAIATDCGFDDGSHAIVLPLEHDDSWSVLVMEVSLCSSACGLTPQNLDSKPGSAPAGGVWLVDRCFAEYGVLQRSSTFGNED